MYKFIKLSRYYFINITVWIFAYFILGLLQFETIEYTLVHISMYIICSGVFSGIIWSTIFKGTIYIREYLPTYFSRVILVMLSISLSAILSVLLITIVNQHINLNGLPNNLEQLHLYYKSRAFYVIFYHTLIVASLHQFVYEMDRKMGKGILLKFLLGRYHKPREEHCVFLFMDLKSSSYYAEQLGHFKYSKLAQDCFNHLSEPVMSNKAQIHQFVGDEVVLTWKIDKHFNPNHCIQCFLDFTQVLNSKKDYYHKTYNILPVFKAGLHAGKVMVAQVGQPKSEIAYHGDAINTASRIQGLCNIYNTKLLLTHDFLKLLNPKSKYLNQMIPLGQTQLKGKGNPVSLFKFS